MAQAGSGAWTASHAPSSETCGDAQGTPSTETAVRAVKAGCSARRTSAARPESVSDEAADAPLPPAAVGLVPSQTARAAARTALKLPSASASEQDPPPPPPSSGSQPAAARRAAEPSRAPSTAESIAPFAPTAMMSSASGHSVGLSEASRRVAFAHGPPLAEASSHETDAAPAALRKAAASVTLKGRRTGPAAVAAPHAGKGTVASAATLTRSSDDEAAQTAAAPASAAASLAPADTQRLSHRPSVCAGSESETLTVASCCTERARGGGEAEGDAELPVPSCEGDCEGAAGVAESDTEADAEGGAVAGADGDTLRLPLALADTGDADAVPVGEGETVGPLLRLGVADGEDVPDGVAPVLSVPLADAVDDLLSVGPRESLCVPVALGLSVGLALPDTLAPCDALSVPVPVREARCDAEAP